MVIGTPAFLHWLRYLPLLDLMLAVPAGVAAATLVCALRRRPKPVAAVVLIGSTASTALASAAIWHGASDTGLS